MEISIDDLDINILKILNGLSLNEKGKKSSITTTSLTKKIYPGLDRNKGIIQESLIKYRLKKLSLCGIILIEKNENINYYNLIANNCFIGRLKKRKAIYLNIGNKWCAITL